MQTLHSLGYSFADDCILNKKFDASQQASYSHSYFKVDGWRRGVSPKYKHKKASKDAYSTAASAFVPSSI
jgi:hypothetical protein